MKIGEGRVLKWYEMVLEKGERERIKDVKGVEIEGVVKMRRMEDERRIEEMMKEVRNVVIIGGGLIGIEMENREIEIGKKKVLIEDENRIIGS